MEIRAEDKDTAKIIKLALDVAAAHLTASRRTIGYPKTLDEVKKMTKLSKFFAKMEEKVKPWSLGFGYELDKDIVAALARNGRK